MSAERAEGQPKTALFPLSLDSTSEAITTVIHLNRINAPYALKSYAGYSAQLYSKSPHLRNHFARTLDSYSAQPSAKEAYGLGATVVGGSLLAEVNATGLELPEITEDDVKNYMKARFKIVGLGTLGASEEGLKHFAKELEKSLCEADPSLKVLIDRIFDEDDDGLVIIPNDVRNKVPYLLGIADGYFPHRLAYARVHLTGSLD